MIPRRDARSLAATAGAVIALSLLGSTARAQTEPTERARVAVDEALREQGHGFCARPETPLRPRVRALCPLASETPGCEAFAAACRADAEEAPAKPPEKPSSSVLGGIAQMLVWALVAALLLAAAYPLVLFIARRRRDASLAERRAEAAPALVERAAIAAPPPVSDAEAALRAADEHAERGELDPAMRLYLAASLVALDRRGAIRIARHKTNGEYVRQCTEAGARAPLRDVVREVDRLEFGHARPTPEMVGRVARRAASVVRASYAVVALALAALLGCNGAGRGPRASDPSGDELPRDVLARTGYDVGPLETSLATLPLPAPSEAPLLVVVDTTRVPLEEESEAHLLRWVDAGGLLLLLGAPQTWPKALAAKEASASSRELVVDTGDALVEDARIGVPRAVQWPGSATVATLDGAVYAAISARAEGAIVGVAGNDLFTNVGVARPANGAALVAIVEAARAARPEDARAMPLRIRVARAEDGISPPSSPFASLAQAGLGRAMWHALVAALLLFLAYGVRHARPAPEPTPARRAFAEHVVATGAFYGRARAHAHALAAYARYAEVRLRERVARGSDAVSFLVARTGAPHADVERIWKRAAEASPEDPPRGDELATIRDLRALLAKALD